MKSDNNIESEVFSIIQSINRACVNGTGFDELADHFANDFIIYLPGFSQRVKSKETSLQMYKDFCSKANIAYIRESDQHVDIFEDTAVVNYHYDTQWEFNGTCLNEDGREIVVFKKDCDHWQLIWRTLIIGNRKTKDTTGNCLAETGSDNDIHNQCLMLMESSSTCELTTIDANGFPCTTCMNNLRNKILYPDLVDLFKNQDNDFIIYMSTANQSDKMARMQANPKVSVYFCDVEKFHGLMLGGEIEIVTDRQLKNKIWQKGWRMYYPGGPEGPEYGIIKLIPAIAKGWSCTGKFEFKLN